MTVDEYRRQLERKRDQRVAAERKAGDLRTKESKKRADAVRARQAAAKSKSVATTSSKLREAERREKEAETAGKEAGRWGKKAADYAREEATLASKLARAEKSQADTAERQRMRDQQQAARASAAERILSETMTRRTKSAMDDAVRLLRAPKPEKLRVLILGASSEGDLRVGRECQRIHDAVNAALHRDQIEMHVHPAATTANLLDGMAKFRPHVVHFSGHSNENVIVFEDDLDDHHEGVPISSDVFMRVIQAADDPPLLVFLNSCNSAAQIDSLVTQVVPFAIGMSDTITDPDAINYAAQFYSSVANGQSIRASHLFGQVALELAGLPGAELPTLAWAPDVDPSLTILVKPG